MNERQSTNLIGLSEWKEGRPALITHQLNKFNWRQIKQQEKNNNLPLPAQTAEFNLSFRAPLKVYLLLVMSSAPLRRSIPLRSSSRTPLHLLCLHLFFKEKTSGAPCCLSLLSLSLIKTIHFFFVN